MQGTHLTDVDKPAHKVLVTERLHRRLGLLPCRVFHNPAVVVSLLDDQPMLRTYPHPYIDPRTTSPTRQSNVHK